METIDFVKAINRIKVIAIVAISGFFILTVFTLIMFIIEKNDKKEKLYVASDLGSFLIKRGDWNARQPWEIKNHVKSTIEDLFENDSYTYRVNIESALNRVDNEMGIKIKDMMEKSGLYELLRKENAYTKVLFDSVAVKEMVQPYEVKVYFKQMVMWRGLNQVIPYGVLLSVTEDSRSEKNPYGLLVNRFDLIKYEPGKPSSAVLNPDSIRATR